MIHRFYGILGENPINKAYNQIASKEKMALGDIQEYAEKHLVNTCPYHVTNLLDI